MAQDNWRVWQDPKTARGFTERRRGGVLGGAEQLDTMLRLLKHMRAPHLDVLDLGCGDGILLQTVTSAYAVGLGVALDGSPAMLEKAEVRFTDLGLFGDLIKFVEADFNDPKWVESLPIDRFDAVVSGLAIHHCEDPRKRELYCEIFEMLKPGGLFVNIEHVASNTPLGEELFEAAYADTVTRFRQGRGEQATYEDVLFELQTRPDKAANRLASVETQLHGGNLTVLRN